jgi:hypothetical protein
MRKQYQLPCTRNLPVSFTLGPFIFERDDYGNWSRNRIDAAPVGFPKCGLEHDAYFLCEEIVRLREKEGKQ